MADGPHLGIRPGSDLPRRTAGRGGPVRRGHRGLPSGERRGGARHSHREHGTDHVPSTDACHPVRVRPHGAAPAETERTPPSPIAANRDRKGRRRRGDDGVPRRDRSRSGSVASKQGQGPYRLRHDGDRDGCPEKTEGALLLLARGSLGIYDRAADGRGASNPPWKGTRARSPGPGSRLRTDPVPGRSGAIPIDVPGTGSIAPGVGRSSRLTPTFPPSPCTEVLLRVSPHTGSKWRL